MNNVDKFDQLLASYKINRQNSKWLHRIFLYFLDASVVNAFCVYKLLNLPKMSAKDFRRGIINGLLAPTLVSSSADSVFIMQKKIKGYAGFAAREFW